MAAAGSTLGIGTFGLATAPMRISFGSGALQHVPELLDEAGLRRILVLSTPRTGDLDGRLPALLGHRFEGLCTEAREHVPESVVRQASQTAAAAGADGCLAIGGGSVIGLAKALALRDGLPYVAVPTSYAGSEMTPIWGVTHEGRKRTGRSPSVHPRAVAYDVDLTLSLPVPTSVASAMNAIAHAAEAIYAPDTSPFISMLAEEAVRRIVAALPRIAAEPTDAHARSDALYGAWLAGICLGSTTMSLHHKLCHVLGGTLDLPHAQTHTVVLPHVLAFNAQAAHSHLAPLAEALHTTNPASSLQQLAWRLGAPRSLRELGMHARDLDAIASAVLAEPYANPRPVDRDGVDAVLRSAFDGLPV
jgi:maleylacetate reductase